MMNVNHHSKEPTQVQQQSRESNRGGMRKERKKKSYLHLINKVTHNIFNLVYLEYSFTQPQFSLFYTDSFLSW